MPQFVHLETLLLLITNNLPDSVYREGKPDSEWVGVYFVWHAASAAEHLA
jgi:hypothetical protein